MYWTLSTFFCMLISLLVRPSRPLIGAATNIGLRRFYATEPQDPKTKAAAIIDALPGNNSISKTGIVATGAAAGVYLISNGIYVVNGESLLLSAFVAVMYVLSKTAGPAYGAWAQEHVDTFKRVLDKARQGHVSAVKERIDNVKPLTEVSAITKDLFTLSKETVELEAKAFESEQRVDFAHEAKSVLDSWVRYEGQVRQREQQELAASVIVKIQKEIGSPKFKQQVLEQSVADVERLFAKA